MAHIICKVFICLSLRDVSNFPLPLLTLSSCRCPSLPCLSSDTCLSYFHSPCGHPPRFISVLTIFRPYTLCCTVMGTRPPSWQGRTCRGAPRFDSNAQNGCPVDSNAQNGCPLYLPLALAVCAEPPPSYFGL